jgi:phosphoglycerate dehydrogenase-like enzyme
MSYNVLYWNPSATPDLRRIVESEMPPAWTLQVLGADGSAAELLPRCDFMIVADRAVTAADLAAAARLRMIQHQGVGYERIDLEACRQRGVLLALTPEGTTTGVAEHTILLILAIYKQLLKASTSIRSGGWLQWELRPNSFELAGKTLGLAGFGRIGQAVAKRASAFDTKILYFDPFSRVPVPSEATRVAALEDLLGESDIVSLHLPGSTANRHLIGKRELELMKPNAILINTSRGNLVDELALAHALASGRIAGAGLDVLENEPAHHGDPLLGFDNVLITPHISAGTVDAFRVKMRAVFENLRRYANAQSPRNIAPELSGLISTDKTL